MSFNNRIKPNLLSGQIALLAKAVASSDMQSVKKQHVDAKVGLYDFGEVVTINTPDEMKPDEQLVWHGAPQPVADICAASSDDNYYLTNCLTVKFGKTFTYNIIRSFDNDQRSINNHNAVCVAYIRNYDEDGYLKAMSRVELTEENFPKDSLKTLHKEL